jgi:preprotein translocase subunit SecD
MPRSICHFVAFLLTGAVCISDATLPVAVSPAIAAEAIPTGQQLGVLRDHAGPLIQADDPLATPVALCVSVVSLSATPSPLAATPGTGPLVGLEVVLELQPAPGQLLDTPTLVGIRAVLQRRLILLGLNGDVLRRRDGKILVRVDVTDDPGRVTHALAESMVLEIIDTRGECLPPGTVVKTTLGLPAGTAPATASTPAAASGRDGLAYETIISGVDFSNVYVTEGNMPGIDVVGFEVQRDAARKLFQYTSTHLGLPMSIVMDKQVVSSPWIQGPISSKGIIEGVPPSEVNDLVNQLKAGALAVPLVLVESRIVPAVAAMSTPVAP